MFMGLFPEILKIFMHAVDILNSFKDNITNQNYKHKTSFGDVELGVEIKIQGILE